MLERELLIEELWNRLSNVPGINRTARNPSNPPQVSDFPIIQFFELNDSIESNSGRGSYPIYKRKLELVIEPFISATSESLSSKELGAFVQTIKQKIYEGGNNLNGKCALIFETRSSRILRPPVGENSVGVSLYFDIIYIENIARLY